MNFFARDDKVDGFMDRGREFVMDEHPNEIFAVRFGHKGPCCADSSVYALHIIWRNLSSRPSWMSRRLNRRAEGYAVKFQKSRRIMQLTPVEQVPCPGLSSERSKMICLRIVLRIRGICFSVAMGGNFALHYWHAESRCASD